MGWYVVEAEPGGPRTAAMVSSLLGDAGATFTRPEIDERRGAEQVFETVRVTFELVGDLSLVWAGVKEIQKRFPQFKVQIRKHGDMRSDEPEKGR